MTYQYRNIRAEFGTPTETECQYKFYGTEKEESETLLAEGKVTLGREITNLSDTALAEFARKYIDVNYGVWYDELIAPQAKEDLPLSDAALKTAAKVQQAADYIVQQCCENTTTGNWIMDFDEIGSALHFTPYDIYHLSDEIYGAVIDKEEVADVDMGKDFFDVVCYLDYCPNYEESPGEELDQSTIRVLRIVPDKAPEVAFVPNTLEGLQKEVEGYIETVTLDDATIIVNEEGKLLGLPANRNFRGDILCGTILICGVDGENFCSLADEQIEKYTKMFAELEFNSPNLMAGLFGISM